MRGRKLTIQQNDDLKLVVFFVVFGFLAIAGSMASAANVGFETIQVSNGTEPPLSGGVWYPAAAPATEHSLPLSVPRAGLLETTARLPTTGNTGPLSSRRLPTPGQVDGHRDLIRRADRKARSSSAIY
jgi:hypothetical protein